MKLNEQTRERERDSLHISQLWDRHTCIHQLCPAQNTVQVGCANFTRAAVEVELVVIICELGVEVKRLHLAPWDPRQDTPPIELNQPHQLPRRPVFQSKVLPQSQHSLQFIDHTATRQMVVAHHCDLIFIGLEDLHELKVNVNVQDMFPGCGRASQAVSFERPGVTL